ncbi:MAG: M48 family metallopeptidase [Propionibacteriaceae bacterium]|nr:M48 family metallopeptidase [Propionibacteriaceae bacterium]
MTQPEVEVRRSARRRRTLTVFRERGRLVALVPARLSAAQERDLVPPLVEKFLRREARRSLPEQDEALTRRARDLFRAYLAPRTEVPLPAFTVRWVGNQNRRWGSCTSADGSIRLSDRLRTMPLWVSDYVILHELAHLFEPNHSAAFHDLLAGYPHLERARAFLQGYQHATDSGPDMDESDDGEPDALF